MAAQAATLDYSPAFQFAQPKSFELAHRISQFMPEGLNRVFFTGSGSESVDSALKIARAYWRKQGRAEKTRLVGRAKGYHGVNFGGISVGGLPANRQLYGQGVEAVHLPHTQLPGMEFSRGQPSSGAELADALLGIIAVHDASTIAAVIVEPMSGSAGVIVPPVGYLERLRELCTQHDILLIFDEVITAFGRLGHPFGAHRFNVMPDIITTAKGLTNGVIPMGAVFVRDEIYDAFMNGPEHMIEIFHGYTYSGHAVAAAAGVATLDVYEEEGTFEQAAALEQHFEDLLHSFADHPLVIDVRNYGLMGAIEMAPREGAPGARGIDAHKKCFWDENMVVRAGMDTLQFSPFLNSDPDEMTQSFEAVRRVVDTVE